MKTMKKLFVLSVLVLAIGSLAIVESCNNEPTSGSGERVTIDIYSFTDFHGVMEDFVLLYIKYYFSYYSAPDILPLYPIWKT